MQKSFMHPLSILKSSVLLVIVVRLCLEMDLLLIKVKNLMRMSSERMFKRLVLRLASLVMKANCQARCLQF